MRAPVKALVSSAQGFPDLSCKVGSECLGLGRLAYRLLQGLRGWAPVRSQLPSHPLSAPTVSLREGLSHPAPGAAPKGSSRLCVCA